MVKVKTLLDILTYAACLLAVAPLMPHLDLPVRLIFFVAIGAGILFDRRGHYPLKGAVATLLSIAFFALYAVRLTLANLVGPVVNILVFLLAVRLITEKSGRNYLQIFVLAVFALASSSLFSLSAAFLVYLVLVVICVTVGLVLLSFHVVDDRLLLRRREARKILSVALLLPAASLVLMLLFFVILPRTEHPLWTFLNPSVAVTGFSDKVAPGTVAGIAAVKNVAFRVESPPLPPQDLYWRGIVLNRLEGAVWVRAEVPAGEEGQSAGGRSVRQTVYLEPKAEGYLFALDVPRQWVGIASQGAADLVHRARRTPEGRLKYEAVSAVGGRIEARGVAREFYLQVPGRPSERVRTVAEGIAREGRDETEKIALLEAFFLARNLAYATDDLPASSEPVDEFLFEKMRGYCEFFASSFATLLRLSGVPARLVGGYYGGKYNPLGGYYVVTEEAAHVWVEALVDGRWIRIDPSRLARNAADALAGPRQKGLNLGRGVVDAVNYYWNRAVIGYDLGRQLQLLRRANVQLRELKVSFDPQKGLLYILFPAAAVAAGVALVRCRRLSREERILRQFLRQVERRYRIDPMPLTVGLEELAARVKDPRCREFAEIYGRAIYRDRQLTEGERGRLKEIIRELRQR